MDVMTILTIVQETDTVTTFAQVYPFLRAGFEAGPIPTRVAMGGSLHVAPLDFIGCMRREYIDREGNFEHDMSLVPFNLSVKVEAGGVVIEGNSLRIGTIQNMAFDLDCLS